MTSETELTISEVTERLTEYIDLMTDEEKRALLKDFETNKRLALQRAHPRKQLLHEIDYAIEGRAFKNFIQDISVGGVFIETRQNFAVGKDIRLVLSLMNMENPIKINGRVVRNSSEGIGVAFNKITPYLQDIIKEKIENI